MSAVRAAFASLTAGQRWTASLAVALGVVVLLFGLPDNSTQLAPVQQATAATSPRAVGAPTAGAEVLPPLQLAVAPLVIDLAPAAPDFAPTTTATTAPAPSGSPPPPASVCTPPLGVTLTGIAQIDTVICTVVASLPVI